jgi:hypothetical protein
LSNIDTEAPVNLKNAWGRSMSESSNNLLAKPSGAPISQIADEFSGKNIESGYGEMFKLVGEDPGDQQLIREFKDYDNAMSKKMKDLKKTGIENIVDTEEQWRKLPEAQQKVTTSLEKLDKEVYDGLKKDFEMCMQFKPKYVVFHDITNDACAGVAHIWNEVKTKYTSYEFTDQYDNVNGTYLGIGLIEMY